MQQSLSDEDTFPRSAVTAPQSERAGTDRENQARPVGWVEALKQVLPIYLATHIAFLALTYLASLFSLGNFSGNALHLRTLWESWNRWDTGWYTRIATQGYDHALSGTWGFFPLFPLLERALALVVQDPFIAGLIISDVATLGLFVVFYRLVAEDFNPDRAWRSVLYLAVFPTAFFLAAAYNEAIFLCFALLSFSSMRRGSWWLAGLFAFGASLTRSTAACLFVPFLYEYFRQRDFQWRKIDWHILSAIGIVGGTILFMIYGYFMTHDALAFEHVQAQGDWQHFLTLPGLAFVKALGIIRHNPLLTFSSIHNIMDLIPGLFILGVLILSFVGPWKLKREHWAYPLYGLATFLLVIIVPEAGSFPIASLSRYMLEVFPAFVVLAAMGKRRDFNLYYLAICLPLLAFWLLQWLTGGWIV
jgi:Dolichyl-phosphate-mannose-protein mannosyltransferase